VRPPQVRLFSQSEARRALAAGDVWAWVGPSEELLPAVASSSNVRLVAPASGTALWADLWVVPAAAGTNGADSAEGDAGERTEPSPLLPLWLEFGLQPARCEGHMQVWGWLSFGNSCNSGLWHELCPAYVHLSSALAGK